MHFKQLTATTALLAALVAPVLAAADPNELLPEYAAVLKDTETLFAKKSPKLKCEAARTDVLKWEGFPVTRCTYVEQAVVSHPDLIIPSPEQLARWTVHACQEAKATEVQKCTERLVNLIRIASSGGIFPVAGYIPEPASAAGGQGDKIICLLFRDGVTVATATESVRTPTKGSCGEDHATDSTITQAKRYARVISTTREEYVRAGGKEAVGKLGDVRWLAVVRAEFQKGLKSRRNFLVTAKAMEEKRNGSFK